MIALDRLQGDSLEKISCSYSLYCLRFAVSLHLNGEDTLRLSIKNEQLHFVLLSVCSIFALKWRRYAAPQHKK
jgi:hypothetical protein